MTAKFMSMHDNAGPDMTEGEARQLFYDIRAAPHEVSWDDILLLAVAFEDTYRALQQAREELQNED